MKCFKKIGLFAAAMSLLLLAASCGNNKNAKKEDPATIVLPSGVTMETPDDLLWWNPDLPLPNISGAVSQTPPQGAPALPRFGNTYSFSKNYNNNFLQPVTLTVPYDPETVPFPTVLYWNSAEQQYESAAVNKIDKENNTISFQTVHFSDFVIAGHPDPDDVISVDTGFDPAVDGFYVPNSGTFTAPGGSSWGMSNFAAWYYRSKKASDNTHLHQQQKGLFNKYREDLDVQRSLFSQVQNALNPIWSNRWNEINHMDEVEVGNQLIENMENTNLPQLLTLRGYDAGDYLRSVQSVLVYKFEANTTVAGTGTFYVYDPNFPGEIVTLTWNANADPAQAFSSYSKAAAYPYPFTDFYFDAATAAGDSASFNLAFTNAQNAAANAALLGSISVTSPALSPNSIANIELTTENIPNVTVTGVVAPPTGQSMPSYLAYMVNGDNSGRANLGGNGAFTFTLTGQDLMARGNIISLRATNDVYDSWISAVFTSFTLNFSGQTVDSFGNMGFEEHSHADHDFANKIFSWRPWDVLQSDWYALPRDTNGSPFEYYSNTRQACIDSGRSQVFCERTDDYGRYYAPSAATGTHNPDYNPEWGFVSQFPANAVDSAKSAVVTDTDLSYNGVVTSETPGVDPMMDYYLRRTDINTTAIHTLPMVFDGTQALRINNGDYNYHVGSARQTAVIPALANPALKFAWAAVLEDPGHDLGNQPFVQVSVYNETKGEYIFREIFISGNPAFTGWQRLTNSNNGRVSPTDSPWNVIPWQTMNIDVSSAAGDEVTIEIIATDCGYGGHGGYAYLDFAP